MTLRYASAVLLAGLAAVPCTLAAQEPLGLDVGGQYFANGEAERYVRALQLVGRVPMHPVSIRPWNRHEARQLTPTGNHPWSARFAAADTANGRHARLRFLRPGVSVIANAGGPQGEGVGAAWLGNGLNLSALAGIRVTAGIADMQLAPLAFWSQNAAFELADNGGTGDQALGDARFPTNIDAPQRFGHASYSRLDPGYSRIAVDTRFVSAGVSTSPLAWGPARNEPLVLGPGAGGFPHAFVGTGAPVRVGIGTLHAKYVAGRIEQTPWSPIAQGNRSRLGTAVVVTFSPAGMSGLEFGGIRFEHREWTPGAVTLSALTRPFGGIFSDDTGNRNSGAENGYASAFARWAIAPAAVELYLEYGREDYTGSLRTLFLKPDDLGSLLLGFQRVFQADGQRMRVLRGELVNAELSSNERGQRGVNRPLPPYLHSGVRQGHTLNGQFLGSSMAYGGAGWTLALDSYASASRTTWSLERRLLRDYLPTPPTEAGRAPQVRYSLAAERVDWRARWGELGLQAALTLELNQHTIAKRDRLLASIGASWRGR